MLEDVRKIYVVEFLSTSKFYNSNSENIFFLGFNLVLFVKKEKLSSSLKINKSFFKRIFHRLSNFHSKFSKYITYRFRSELLALVNKTFLDKKFLGKLSYDRKFWLYVFQLESVKLTQFNKLLLFNDNVGIPKELISTIKSSFYNQTQKYLFSFFISKLQILTRNLLKEKFLVISSSVIPLDSAIQNLLLDVRKKLFLFYNNTFFTSSFLREEKLIENIHNQNVELLSDLYNLGFSISDKYFLKNLFFSKKSFKNFPVLQRFELYISREFLYQYLRRLGFLHKLKNRPVSNPKYLFFSDGEIIRIFSYFATSFIGWFICVYNISDIKYIIELLRQSCLLTLCRKHNKRKLWALEIYTSDLLISDGLHTTFFSFPRKSFVLNLKRKFLFFHSENFFNEKFFL